MTDPAAGAQPPYPAPPVPVAPPVAQPQYFAPPAVNPGYAAHAPGQHPQGYAQPPQGYGPFVAPSPGAAPALPAPGLGLVGFVLGLVAAIVAPIVGAVAAFTVGSGINPRSLSSIEQPDASVDWSILTPVREWVLWVEIAFWAGTALGIWALVQGIVAIARKRGRGWGIAAVVLAVLGAAIFAMSVTIAGFAGLATSAGRLA